MAVRIPIRWSEEELRRAVHALSSAESGITARFNAEFRLGNAIDELIKLRTRKDIATILRRIARNYQDYERAACHLMNRAAALEDAARHAAKALEWQMRYRTVRIIAEEMGITLEEEQADGETPEPATGGVLPSDHAQITLAADQNCELVMKNGAAAMVLNGVTLSPISFSYTITRTAESVLEKPLDPFAGMPDCIRAWLREIDWPYTGEPMLLFVQDWRHESWTRKNIRTPWGDAWKHDEPVVVSILNAPVDPRPSARFQVDVNDVWTRLPEAEQAGS